MGFWCPYSRFEPWPGSFGNLEFLNLSLELQSTMVERVAIILAAGVSNRMNTQMPKVLHEVCGRPMLAYVLDACREVGVERIYVVVLGLSK